MSYRVHLLKIPQLIRQRARPILLAIAILALPAGATAGIVTPPYVETFEEYTNGTPLVDGINEWYGSSSDIIVTNMISTNVGVISTNKAMIPVDCTLSNRGEITNNIGILMQMDANFAFYNGEIHPVVDTNSAVLLYVDSNGYFVVHNGAPSPYPTNSINWVTLQTNAAGQAIDPLLEDESVRLNFRLHYTDKKWALYANDTLLTNNIGFVNTTPTNFTGFDIYNGSSTSYLDNIYVSIWHPGLELSTNDVGFEVWQGQPAVSNQVEVWNNNSTAQMAFTNTVSYTNCDGFTDWLTVAPTTSVSAGAKQGVWLRVDASGMPPRTNAYEATVQVTAQPDTENSPQEIRVTVLVQGVRLWVSTNNISRELTAGQTLIGDTFQVANTGAPPRGTISYSISTPDEWLTVSPTSGSAQHETNTVSIEYSTAALAAGWHTGQVSVVAQGTGVGEETIEVVLRVNHRPGIAWDAGSRIWTNEVSAGGSLGSTTVEVWNASATPAGSLRYQLSVLEDAFGWVSSVDPASGTSTGNHQSATISFTTTGLAAGVYTAQLKVAGTDAATGEASTNGPFIVGLRLTVKGTAVLKTSPASLSQTVLENHTGTNSFAIWNDGREPRGGMLYFVAPDASWAAVSPSTGVVTNDADSVQVVWGTAGAGLPPGVYQGNLIVTAFDAQTLAEAQGSPTAIPLTLTVTPRTPLNMELPTVAGIMHIGQTIDADVGLWRNQERMTFTYQWEKASDKSGGGLAVLSGATGVSYAITTADRGAYLRVGVTATDPTPFALLSAKSYSAWTNSAKVKALRADFNGDGITDLWYYDASKGAWHASFGTSDSVAGIFGGADMLAVPGDYNGDGIEDIAVYDPAHGMWYIAFLPSCTVVYGSLFGGTVYEAEATPMPADYDGDGATDAAFYWQGYWAVLYSTLGTIGIVEPFAETWCEPVSGDWDGNGVMDMGAYYDGVWTLRMGNGAVVVQEFGGEGAHILPAPADYDGDGVTDLGVYDTGLNQWRWRESRSGFEQNISFGQGGVLPMPGYYDHDRSNDWAQVFSYKDDFIVWEVKRTTETNFPYRSQSFQQSTERWRVSW